MYIKYKMPLIRLFYLIGRETLPVEGRFGSGP